MEIYYAIFVSLLLLYFAKAQPEPWICTFQDDECDISQSLADDSYWYIPDNAGNPYYRPAINRAGDTYGTFATFILPPASYPSSGLGVLSFRFVSYTVDPPRFSNGYITVRTCKDRNPILILHNQDANWYSGEIKFTCGSNPVEISFTASRGYSQTIIGVDTITVTEILTTTTVATSVTSQVTRIQTMTPIISPSLTSSSIPTYTETTKRHNMSTGSILDNSGKGGMISNHVILPVVSSICIVLLICLIVSGYVFWRKRYRPTPIEDKDSDDNRDKLYTNPVYSSYDNAHSQPDLLVGTPTGQLSQETQQAHESIDEYEEFEGDRNRQLYAKPLRRQDRTEHAGDNPTDIKDKNLPAHAVLYDDEEYNALDFNRDKFPKTTQNCPKSQTYKPSIPGDSSAHDAFDYGVLECPGVLGDGEYSSTAEAIGDPRRSAADSKAPRYENSEPGVPSAADQMEEGPEYYSYQDSLPVRPEDEYSIEHARSAAEVPREVDFEPIYSDEVYGDIQ